MENQARRKDEDQDNAEPLQRQSVMPVKTMSGSFLSAMTDSDIDVVMSNANKFMLMQDKLRKTALKLTNSNDWVDQEGTPYLEVSGTNKVAMGFGVSYQELGWSETRKTDENGPYVEVVSKIEVTFMGNTITQTGTASTRDNFFGKTASGWKPLSEVNMQNIIKKATTNAIQRGIKSRLGLDFTWEEIEESTGGKVTKEKCAGVSYTGGGKGGTGNAATPEAKTAREAVWKKLLEMNNGHVVEAQKHLAELTSFQGREGMVPGKTEISKVSDQAMSFLTPKVEAEYKKFLAAKPATPAAAKPETPAQGAK
jgi:hypothetical protein